jgi:fumarylacetoacetate (FAA) hydrolase
MDFHFGQLDRPPGAHAQRARRQHRRRGTVSNADGQGLELHCREARAGDHRQRRAEDRLHALGDTIRIEMKGRDGQSVFGAIEQRVVRAE